MSGPFCSVYLLQVYFPHLPRTSRNAEHSKHFIDYLTTVRATVVVCVLPPPVPLMVIVNVFSAAVVPTLTVIVDIPEPGAPMGLGLNVTFCAPPAPVADNVIAELKLPSAAVVIVAVPDAPRATVIAVGDA